MLISGMADGIILSSSFSFVAVGFKFCRDKTCEWERNLLEAEWALPLVFSLPCIKLERTSYVNKRDGGRDNFV